MTENPSIRLPKGCFLVRLPKISDARGHLAFGESEQHIPFAIKRVFWTYGIKDGNLRGDHAHRTCQMVIFPLGGSFDIELDDGHNRMLLHMDDPSIGIFVPPLVWCKLSSFSPEGTCVSLASEEYRAEDYIHSYQEFLSLTRA